MPKLTIHAECCCSPEKRAANTLRSEGCPSPPPIKGNLAVVGGGPSVLDYVDELQNFDGEIWAINGAYNWCREHGINCTLFSVDPDPLMVPLCHGAERAIFAAHCDFGCFESVDEVYRYEKDVPGPTSAVAACFMSMDLGADHVLFYGCESSYGGQTHIYGDQPLNNSLVRIEIGGDVFLTKLELILQVEQMSAVFRRFPDRFTDKSGGFLGMAVAGLDYDVTHVHKSMEVTAI